MSDLIFPEDPIVGQWFTATNDAVYEWNGVTWIAIGTRNQGNYFLPTASTTILGGVKLDGLTITADENGVISVSGGGSSDRLVNGLNEVVLGTDGTFTLPNGTNIYGDGIFKADAIGGFEFNSFTDNIGGGKKTWDFGTDGSLTLPAGGTISYSPATPSHWNNIAPTTIEHAIDRLAAAIKNLNGTGA
jgi:hypothetical protein